MRNALAPIIGLAALVIGVVAFIAIIVSFYMIPPGHVGVTVLGGRVTGSLDSGWGFINPLASIEKFDCREKTHDFDRVGIRSKDQLETYFDVSVQYRLNATMAEGMFAETGRPEAVVETHMIPKFRSIARDIGRTVSDSKEFFSDETQSAMAQSMTAGLQEFLQPKGILVADVLIRAIDPPDFIEEAVQRREEREQETDRQRAELERFEIEQQQKVALAQAELEAAQAEADRVRALAQADADAIVARGEALRENPEVIEMMRVEQWNGVLPRFVGAGEGLSFLLPMEAAK